MGLGYINTDQSETFSSQQEKYLLVTSGFLAQFLHRTWRAWHLLAKNVWSEGLGGVIARKPSPFH